MLSLLKSKNKHHYYIVSILTTLLLVTACDSDDNDRNITIIPQGTYHTPEELNLSLNNTALQHPDITYLEPVGTSIEDRTIWALVISENPQELEQEPRIRITGSIHGDENVTTEVIIRFIDYLTDNYSTSQNIKSIIDNRYIVFIPMMNPDGVFYNNRYNANDVDLNRNFSVAWSSSSIAYGASPFSEPESSAFRDYSLFIGFHLSITYHTGAAIVNMPFDYASAHYDDVKPVEYDLVTYFGELYATSGSFLETPGLLEGPYVNNGAVNGGDWYVVSGSLQDWSYVETGCIDYTIEISRRKKPSTSDEIDAVYDLNRDSIIAFLENAGIGVYGRISSSAQEGISAEIKILEGVTEGDIVTDSDESGYYHRVLLPGNYNITFSAQGYHDHTQSVAITDTAPSLQLDVTMTSE